MTDWPMLDELKQVLDVDPESDAWDGDYDDTRLTRLLASAIAYVKQEVGDWDEDYGFPDDRLSQAALRMAELLALKPEVASGISGPGAVASDPVYRALMTGKHVRFGFS